MDKDRSRLLKDNAFREVNRYEPPRVKAARKRGGEAAANKMKAGIALDDARAKGVRIPRKQKR